MTTLESARWRSGVAVRQWLPAALLLFGLAAIIAVRWWATRAGLDPLAVGLVFGAALAVLSLVARGRREDAERGPRMDVLRGAGIGVGFGLVLVALVAVGAALAGALAIPTIGRPAAPFAPWAAITILVATAEEALLRGRLFDAVRRTGGVGQALAITTIAFALMHVPLYGWQVVPLDLAVGLAFGGLRLATGRVAVPAAAHVVADLATWWL